MDQLNLYDLFKNNPEIISGINKAVDKEVVNKDVKNEIINKDVKNEIINNTLFETGEVNEASKEDVQEAHQNVLAEEVETNTDVADDDVFGTVVENEVENVDVFKSDQKATNDGDLIGSNQKQNDETLEDIKDNVAVEEYSDDLDDDSSDDLDDSSDEDIDDNSDNSSDDDSNSKEEELCEFNLLGEPIKKKDSVNTTQNSNNTKTEINKKKPLSGNKKVEKDCKDYKKIIVKYSGIECFVLDNPADIVNIKLDSLKDRLIVEKNFGELNEDLNWRLTAAREEGTAYLQPSSKLQPKG